MLDIAENNRFKCTECNTTIGKGDKYFRDAKSGWRSSHTVNICNDCISKMFFELNLPLKLISKLKKEFLVEQIVK
jgi:RNase P subunit RPR2